MNGINQAIDVLSIIDDETAQGLDKLVAEMIIKTMKENERRTNI